jgi:hypothetical protein
MRGHWKKEAIGILMSAAAFTAGAWGQDCVSACPGSSSGPIKVFAYPLGGGAATQLDCHAAATDFSVNISSLSGAVVLHIFDCGGSNSIGQVTVAGTSSGLTSLAVLVASSSTAWDEAGTTLLSVGCVNFGGLIVSNGTTESITRASIACSGSITQVSSSSPPAPDVVINQVIRIQAGARIDGKVNAKVTGTLYGSTSNAIKQVRAQDGIRGEVKADSNDIFAVRVLGTSSSLEGITGDIKAESGKISAISSTGAIGSTSHTSQIRAKDGILQTWCGYTESGSTNGTRIARVAITGNVSSTATSPYGSPIQEIRVTGDLNGSVTTTTLGVPDGSQSADEHAYGIYAAGAINAPITITDAVSYAEISAPTITAEVRVGRYLIGSVIATDEVHGEIASIVVGRDYTGSTSENGTGFFGAIRGPAWDPTWPACIAYDPRSDPMPSSARAGSTIWISQPLDRMPHRLIRGTSLGASSRLLSERSRSTSSSMG